MTENDMLLLKTVAREIINFGKNKRSLYRNKLIQQIAQGIFDYDYELYLAKEEIKRLKSELKHAIREE